MTPRDKFRIVRYTAASDGGGGSLPDTKVETELVSGVCEVKEVKTPQRLDLMQTQLKKAIQIKFWRRKELVLLAGDTLFCRGLNWTLLGPDVTEDALKTISVVSAIQQS